MNLLKNKFIKYILLILNIIIILCSKNEIKVMYYISDNFGDNLNYYILKKITKIRKLIFYDTKIDKPKKNLTDENNINILNQIAKTDLFFIGSILNVICNWRYPFKKAENKYKSIINKLSYKLYNFLHPLIIFGSGFSTNNTQNESYVRNIKIIAIRGNFSLQRFIKNGIKVTSNNIIFADPAILFPLIFKLDKNNIPNKFYNLCIIPHYVDKKNFLIQKKIKVNNSLILNIEDNPYKFVNSLLQCKRVISSSLHGLIISDSFGIPNMRIIISERIIGGDFKFKDYYSAYGLDLTSKLDLRKETFTEKHINLIDNNYKITLNMIKKKQCELLIN
jgi:pyruvyltransferase